MLKDKFKEKLQRLSSRELIYGLVAAVVCLVAAMAVQLQPEKQEAAAMPVAQVTVQDDPRTVMVLNYHKVMDEHMSLSVPLADFEQHMKWLKEYGYTSITPEELYEFIVNGSELPEKPVLITFDDGYKDNYTNAYPIMKKYGFTGTIFVVTGFLGVYDNYMTWEQAKGVKRFGLHTMVISNERRTEGFIYTAKLMFNLAVEIKNKLGIDADFMAYPTGTYNLHIAELVQKAGYKGAFTIKYDNVSRESNVYALERVPIFHTENTNKDFLERIQYLPLIYKYGWVKN